MAGVKFTWNGPKLWLDVKDAQRAGLMKTGMEVCDDAKTRVNVATGALQSSIMPQTDEPEETGTGFKLDVGSDEEDIPYAAIQELGPVDGRPYSYSPYMRPAVDSVFHQRIEDNIRSFMK